MDSVGISRGYGGHVGFRVYCIGIIQGFSRRY